MLFFNASWHPSCRSTKATLTEAGVPAGLTVVGVAYDSSKEVRKRYRVTHQHTFVQVGESGEKIEK